MHLDLNFGEEARPAVCLDVGFHGIVDGGDKGTSQTQRIATMPATRAIATTALAGSAEAREETGSVEMVGMSSSARVWKSQGRVGIGWDFKLCWVNVQSRRGLYSPLSARYTKAVGSWFMRGRSPALAH
jgi:hypothetical protein